jgi:hypothetical protein
MPLSFRVDARRAGPRLFRRGAEIEFVTAHRAFGAAVPISTPVSIFGLPILLNEAEAAIPLIVGP